MGAICIESLSQSLHQEDEIGGILVLATSVGSARVLPVDVDTIETYIIYCRSETGDGTQILQRAREVCTHRAVA